MAMNEDILKDAEEELVAMTKRASYALGAARSCNLSDAVTIFWDVNSDYNRLRAMHEIDAEGGRIEEIIDKARTLKDVTWTEIVKTFGIKCECKLRE